MADLKFSDIQAEMRRRKSLFSRWHREQEIDELFLTASAVQNGGLLLENHLSHLPKGFTARIPPIAPDAVHIAASQIYVGETPTVKVLLPPLHRVAEKQQQAIELLEKKLQALLWAVDTSNVESPLLPPLWDGLGYGLGILSYPIDWRRWTPDPFALETGKRRKPRNAQEREQDEHWQQSRFLSLPWDVHSIHPRRGLFDPDSDPPEDIITVEQVDLAAMARRYPHLAVTDGERQRHATAELISFCSEDAYGMWVRNKPVLTAKQGADEEGIAENTWGVMWYAFCQSGFGHTTFKGEWEFRRKGILRDARDIISMYIAAINQVEAIRGIYAFTPLEVIGPEEERAALGLIRYGPGEILEHSERVKITAMQTPDVPQFVYTAIDQLHRFIELHFGPEVLRGIREGGETFQGQQGRLSQAQATLRVAKQSWQQALSKMLMDMCLAIKRQLRGPLTILDQEGNIVDLGPDDIHDGIRILVNASPPTAGERIQEQEERFRKVQARLYSRRRAMEADPEIENVEDERAQIIAEQLEDTPAALELLGRAMVYQTEKELERRGLLPPPVEATGPESSSSESSLAPGSEFGPAPISRLP